MHNIKQNKAMKGGKLKVGSYSNQGGRWWGVDQVRCPWGETQPRDENMLADDC